MRILLHALLIALTILSAGCRSTIRMQSKTGLLRFDGGAQPVYVTNPNIAPEYEILKASGVYQLAPQPEGARKLTLHPIQHHGRCGNPLMLTFLTFGIIPGVLPAGRTFDYDLEMDGIVERRVHNLPLYERFSLWEWLVKRDEHTVLTEALAWSTLQRSSAD